MLAASFAASPGAQEQASRSLYETPIQHLLALT
jgi:hypothetical protein